MRIKSYKIKENTTIQKILDNGFKYSINTKYLTKYIHLKSSIGLYVRIPLENIFSFNDLSNVDVLDDNFCQIYTPFFNSYDKDIDVGNKFLISVIERYNQEMDKITFLEVKPNEI